MNHDEPVTCTWCQDHIEAYLDDDLTAPESARLHAHLAGCDVCTADMELAARIRTSLHDMPLPDVPEAVTAGVYNKISAERGKLSIFRHPVWRGLAVAAALIAAILLGTGEKQKSEQASTVSSEELARAESQAKWAIAYISDVGRRTGLTVRDEIISEKVVGTLNKSVDTVMRREE